MSRVLEMLPSGLMVPQEPPKKPAREYGPLEFDRKLDRERVAEALDALWDATRSHQMLSPDDRLKNRSRRALVEAMIFQFLGDVEFAEKC